MDIRELRHAKDEFFRRSHESPLSEVQRKKFTGLVYFPEDPAHRFEVTLDADASEVEQMQLSDGASREMTQAGHVRFPFAGGDKQLLAYEQGHELFIPFRDKTSGKETYGAGRYLEAEHLGGSRYLLDFNTAYNPYCAYNDAWSCPLPPLENWLDVEIRAGEKTFPH
jgi:uncharacterized protein (DUF1684 family)